jgi:hypothetical protein
MLDSYEQNVWVSYDAICMGYPKLQGKVYLLFIPHGILPMT